MLSSPEIYRDYGIWTDHRIPDDRSDWHPMVRFIYEYWLTVAPPGRLPGRRHIAPEDLVPCLPRIWLLDVYREPVRLRFRLMGTDVVRSLGEEATGRWVDEVHADSVLEPVVANRYRYIIETGRPTWRHGPTRWKRDPRHRSVENCLLPLAEDGSTVDMILGLDVPFDVSGKEIKL